MLDMATVRSPRKARVAMSRGERLGPNLVIDNQGRATKDPSVMYTEPRGSLLPFGDHKDRGLR